MGEVSSETRPPLRGICNPAVSKTTRSCGSGGGGEENKNVKEVQLMKRNDLLIHAKLLKGSERFRGSLSTGEGNNEKKNR